MSEDKKDIQSHIDRLDLDWRGGLDDYKVKRSIRTSVLPRMPSEIPYYSLRIAVGIGLPSIGLVCCVYFLFSSEDAVKRGMFALLSISNAMVLFAVSRDRRRHLAAVQRYAVALDGYESKRSELQAKLEALD